MKNKYKRYQSQSLPAYWREQRTKTHSTLSNSKRYTTIRNSQLPAFTLMEVMVTLVLTGIIIAAALSLYLNYEKLVRLKNNQMNCGKENLQFYYTFKHEFDKASMIKSDNDMVTFVQPDRTIVSYEINQDYIVRLTKNMSDTFLIKVNDFGAVKDEITGGDKIVKMELRNCGEIFPVVLVKQYSNDVLMNR